MELSLAYVGNRMQDKLEVEQRQQLVLQGKALKEQLANMEVHLQNC